VDHPISSDWRYTGQSFLIGTVALGGAVNILPVVFAKVRMRRADMIKFLGSILAGLLTVWILNVIWCYYVLKIVPQQGEISLAK